MAPLPAICERCGRAFYVDRFVGGNALMVQIEDCVAPGSCPYCRGDGRIIDGAYSLRDNVARLLTRLERDDMLRLQALLQTMAADASRDDVVQRIHDEVPNAAPIADVIANQGQHWTTWLMIIIALLSLMLQTASFVHDLEQQPPAQQNVELDRLLRLAIEQQHGRAQMPTPGRNDPCWCGSGKKFKHCHGG